MRHLVFIFFLVFLLLPQAYSAQKAKVLINGAMVFRAPNFDSDVIGYLKKGDVYFISTQKKGDFYRIALRPKVYGWVVDTDVQTEKQIKKIEAKEADEDLDKINEIVTEEEKDQEIFFTRYIGPVFGQLGFSEKTFRGIKKDDMSVYGVQVIGPRTLLDGPILTSFNLLMAFDAPKYYGKLTGNEASGLLLLADFLLISPFYGGDNYMFYYGLGPLVRWNQFKVEAGNSALDLQDIHLGATIEVGAALQLGSMALRAEYRYFWEVVDYKGFSFSVQKSF